MPLTILNVPPVTSEFPSRTRCFSLTLVFPTAHTGHTVVHTEYLAHEKSKGEGRWRQPDTGIMRENSKKSGRKERRQSEARRGRVPNNSKQGLTSAKDLTIELICRDTKKMRLTRSRNDTSVRMQQQQHWNPEHNTSPQSSRCGYRRMT